VHPDVVDVFFWLKNATSLKNEENDNLLKPKQF